MNDKYFWVLFCQRRSLPKPDSRMTWKNIAYRGTWPTECLPSFANAVWSSHLSFKGTLQFDEVMNSSLDEYVGIENAPPVATRVGDMVPLTTHMGWMTYFASGPLKDRKFYASMTLVEYFKESETTYVTFNDVRKYQKIEQFEDCLESAVNLHATLSFSPSDEKRAAQPPATTNSIEANDSVSLSLFEAVVFYVPDLPINAFPTFTRTIVDIPLTLTVQIENIAHVWKSVYESDVTSSSSLQEYLLCGHWDKQLCTSVTDLTTVMSLVGYFSNLSLNKT